MQIVDQIRDRLQRDGLSVLKLSNKTGISAYKIYKWLDGKGNPKHDDAVKLAKWLGNIVEEVPNVEEGAGHSNGTPLTGSMTIQDHIANIEARRLEAVARAEEIKAMYHAVQQEKGVLYDIIKENLTQLMANSNKHLAYLEKILLVDRADHETTMDSLDRIEHQPVGSNAKRAGKRELDASKRLRKKDRASGVNK